MVGVKPPLLVRALLSRYTWNMGDKKKNVYLTFDDGPTPEITPWILNKLDEYNVKATFFCIGRNVERDIDLYNNIINRGHHVGNHTYSHLNGLKTKDEIYFQDIFLAAKYINSRLFRPPYGLIRRSQGKYLVKKYKVIMWDTLSYDFSEKIDHRTCFKNISKKIRKGSIIVFHDSVKAWKNLQFVLPETLEYLEKNGYNCKPIENK